MVGVALETRENEAYSAMREWGGPEMKENEPYGVATLYKSRGTMH